MVKYGKSVNLNVEYIVTKGKVNFEQFLLWPQCFLDLFAEVASQCIYKWEKVNFAETLSVSGKRLTLTYKKKSVADDFKDRKKKYPIK